MSTATVREFKTHPRVILTLIREQSGSLSKAVGEAVMNSADAGATWVSITLSPQQLIIEDNGRGINAEAEIEEFFNTFGTPHALDENENSTDAKFGKFRIGRGQLFNYGHNTWTTGPFKMVVDLNAMMKRGDLKWETHSLPKAVDGCTIEIELYDRLSAAEMINITEEITRMCKYMDMEIRLNNELVNTPPSTVRWTEETEDAYIKVNDGHTRGVEFYQQGIYVMTVPSWQVGSSGIIVTKKPVALNFARNDVKRTDKLFNRVIAKFKKDSAVRARTKRDLTHGERKALLNQLLSGEESWSNNLSVKLFPDTNGTCWSINQLRRLPGQEKIITQPDTTIGYCFAEKGDRRGDVIMKLGLGIVFDLELLDLTRLKAEKFFDTIDYSLNNAYSHIPIHQLGKGADDKFRVIEEKDQTSLETEILRTMEEVMWFIMRAKSDIDGDHFSHGDRRVLRVGISTCAEAWTDGKSYVAFSRDFLQKCGQGWGWVDLANLLLHEMCHAEADTGTHVHGPEFHQLYHDIQAFQAPAYGKAIGKAYIRFSQRLSELAGKVTKKQRMEAIKNNTLQEDLAAVGGTE